MQIHCLLFATFVGIALADNDEPQPIAEPSVTSAAAELQPQAPNIQFGVQHLKSAHGQQLQAQQGINAGQIVGGPRLQGGAQFIGAHPSIGGAQLGEQAFPGISGGSFRAAQQNVQGFGAHQFLGGQQTFGGSQMIGLQQTGAIGLNLGQSQIQNIGSFPQGAQIQNFGGFQQGADGRFLQSIGEVPNGYSHAQDSYTHGGGLSYGSYEHGVQSHPGGVGRPLVGVTSGIVGSGIVGAGIDDCSGISGAPIIAASPCMGIQHGIQQSPIAFSGSSAGLSTGGHQLKRVLKEPIRHLRGHIRYEKSKHKHARRNIYKGRGRKRNGCQGGISCASAAPAPIIAANPCVNVAHTTVINSGCGDSFSPPMQANYDAGFDGGISAGFGEGISAGFGGVPAILHGVPQNAAFGSGFTGTHLPIQGLQLQGHQEASQGILDGIYPESDIHGLGDNSALSQHLLPIPSEIAFESKQVIGSFETDSELDVQREEALEREQTEFRSKIENKAPENIDEIEPPTPRFKGRKLRRGRSQRRGQ